MVVQPSRVGLQERGLTKQHPGPPGWGFGAGLTALPCKKSIVPETSQGKTDVCHPEGLKHCNASMISVEAHAGRTSLLDAKTRLNIGTWNVRTMFDTSKTMQVIREM
ncbi:hypothetical protein OS493_001607 [Desmophyllum pertusum]|uniref:Uncharacterized protein n=1 Tax=Desmophyllum pertusum TaxID=174260 RepID=A0A9W9ZIA8_9CNID|nr:hypothetical protein OS493_001607 [Desmophyllum pertusum]